MFVESLHHEEIIKKGDLFLRYGQKNWKIGKVVSGVLRGYAIDEMGNEMTTHFYREGDMVFGNYIPDVACSMNIEAIEESIITTAIFSEIMSHVNKNEEITKIMNTSFHKLNTQLQSRLIALSNLKSIEKYTLFLKEYPNLLNRVPHYHIANFLGITPTQLSRARKEFAEK
ncbi:Crp/Fnr family transcriptional regulator [Flavivirga spongiicola]|uniref:Crp/Fnr family transcriptional regulator n=1 Tax=Flavivirga spongiicola TaxID=421621 RepID=A0ABU7XP02_9FLAO|nr:Crp/Fnr family transcriptional regulator [Flavivirga sp. MEBiC05379]MDO5977502.1 Crp/Fnr family transcriptional regulator [Flavivirga sp. MEBiC05379]